jgi:hypothetical protein
MAVWLMRRLQCLPCEQSTLFPAEIAIGAGTPAHRQIIVKTTCCAREDAQALNHGGTTH